MLFDVIDLQHVASKTEAVAGKTRYARDDSDSDDEVAQSVDSLTKYAPPAYDPSLHLSSSLGHLQLECVPEHLTELEEEVERAGSDVNDGEETLMPAVHESPSVDTAADLTAAVSSDDGLQQLGTDESISASMCDTVDVSVHAESKPLLCCKALHN